MFILVFERYAERKKKNAVIYTYGLPRAFAICCGFILECDDIRSFVLCVFFNHSVHGFRRFFFYSAYPSKFITRFDTEFPRKENGRLNVFGVILCLSLLCVYVSLCVLFVARLSSWFLVFSQSEFNCSLNANTSGKINGHAIKPYKMSVEERKSERFVCDLYTRA